MTGDSYVLFKDKTFVFERVAKELSREDGHPSFSPVDRSCFVTDTYPDPDDKKRARLILYDKAKDKQYLLDELDSIDKYDNSPLRCDLHPRWSLDGKYISVDTMDGGCRRIYVYKIQINS